LRCRNCRARFTAQVWRLSNVAYARCPKCFKMDLSVWEERHYVGPAYKILMLRLGAHPYRCEYCRLNFVAFRRRKTPFSWHQWGSLAGKNKNGSK
jgi:Zn ribbon nucleic-acid-binding protein